MAKKTFKPAFAARIRKNRYGNWYGYAGKWRVEAFANTPQGSAEENAQEWLEGMRHVERAFENDAKRAHLYDEKGRLKCR